MKELASFPLGTALIREFGGLRVGRSGPGLERVASDVVFFRQPSAAHRYAVAEMESPGDDLFPLGEAHDGHMEIFIDTRGRLWVDSIPDGELLIAGNTFADGIERLLLGHMWPDKQSSEPHARADDRA